MPIRVSNLTSSKLILPAVNDVLKRLEIKVYPNQEYDEFINDSRVQHLQSLEKISVENLDLEGSGSGVDLQATYDASPDGAKTILLSATGGGVSIGDITPSVGAPIFSITDNAGATNYFDFSRYNLSSSIAGNVSPTIATDVFTINRNYINITTGVTVTGINSSITSALIGGAGSNAIGLSSIAIAAPSAFSGGDLISIRGISTNTAVGTLERGIGASLLYENAATGVTTSSFGLYVTNLTSSGNVTLAVAGEFVPDASGGTISTMIGVHVAGTTIGGGTINSKYGIHVEDQLDYIMGGDSLNLVIGSPGSGVFSIYNNSLRDNFFNGSIGVLTDTPFSTVDIRGSLGAGINTVVTDTNVLTTDTYHTILVDASLGAVVIRADAAVNMERRILVIKKIDATGNTITFDPNGIETVDGALNWSTNVQWDGITVQCDGTAWFILP